MDASTVTTDSNTGHNPGKTLVGSSVTSLTVHPGKKGLYPVQTLNGSQTMNSHNSGSASPIEGSIVTSGTRSNSNAAVTAVTIGPVTSKGLVSTIFPPSSNSVIQTPLMNSQHTVASAQPANQVTGPTVTLARPPMQPEGSGTTLNGNNSVSPGVIASTTTCQTGIAIQTPVVNNSQTITSVSVSTGSHVIKAEPPTTITPSASQSVVIPSAPRNLGTVAIGQGGVRALTPQLTPRLPQTSPGQPSIHNIQLPPGEWVVF